MKKFLFILIFFFSFLSLFFSCDDSTGPPNNNAKLNLTLEDASCTEVWLKLQVDNTALKSDVIIYRDNVEIKKINNIIGNDTIIYDENLLPNKTYTYKAIKIVSEKEIISSKEVVATTMDTTSHNFTFKTFTFGEHSSSVLYDVAIVNENCIYAVGEIYMNDSLGNPDPIFYNLAVWDGQKWEIRRVRTEFRGNEIIVPLEGIFAFSKNDIWLVGSLPIHGDGQNWTMYDLRTTTGVNLSLSKAWGKNTNDMYFVGRSGSIANFQDGKWSKIESGTELVIGDIWGIENNDHSYNKYLAADDAMLVINKDDNIQKIKTEEHSISSVWGKTNNLIYTAGGYGLFLYKNYKWEKVNLSGTSTIRIIRGQNYNDIIGLGEPGIILKFNGINWKSIDTKTYNIFYRLDIKNSLIATVGWNGDKAIITLLRNK